MNDGTLKVTPITAAASQQTSAKFSITATIDGFPVTVEVEGKADQLRAMIDRLKAIGATPPAGVNLPNGKDSSVPHCPVHNTPMKPSQKPGAFFCPKRLDDGSYCKSKA